MNIKICGITDLADARYAASLGATHLGFVQHESSPRYIHPASASEIIEWLFGVQSVGVFVDRSPDEINQIAADARFDAVQLHGSESLAVCSEIEKPVIKAFRMDPGASAESLRTAMEPFRTCVEFFLLDAYSEAAFGGTGRTVDWRVARTLADEFPLFLAGGINPDNASQAILRVQPAGIDASSSLESTPGKKDFKKLDAFFCALRTMDETIDSP